MRGIALDHTPVPTMQGSILESELSETGNDQFEEMVR
jgi:hypothetical protein